MTQIGEIRIAAAELAELTASRSDAALSQEQRGAGDLAHRVETDLRRLQAAALELRVVPIDTILNRFPRSSARLPRSRARTSG